MKKFINDVALVEDQMIQGMVKAYPGYLRKLDCGPDQRRRKRARTGSRRIRGMRHAGRGCGRRSVYIAYPGPDL